MPITVIYFKHPVYTFPWAVYFEGPPSFIWGGERGGEEEEPKKEALLFQCALTCTFDKNIQKSNISETVRQYEIEKVWIEVR